MISPSKFLWAKKNFWHYYIKVIFSRIKSHAKKLPKARKLIIITAQIRQTFLVELAIKKLPKTTRHYPWSKFKFLIQKLFNSQVNFLIERFQARRKIKFCVPTNLPSSGYKFIFFSQYFQRIIETNNYAKLYDISRPKITGKQLSPLI